MLAAIVAGLPVIAALSLSLTGPAGSGTAQSDLLRFQANALAGGVNSALQDAGPPLTGPLNGSRDVVPPDLTRLPAPPALSRLDPSDPSSIPSSAYPASTVEAIITAAADAQGVDPAWMISTAECESGLRTNAYNPSGPYYGIFQFLLSTFRAHGGTDVWDPVQQSEIAASMFASGDSVAWPVCSRR